MKYRVSAEDRVTGIGFNETFNGLWFALKAVKSAVKRGFTVTIEGSKDQ